MNETAVIAVGLATGVEGFDEWLTRNARSRADVKLVSAGCVEVAAVSEWVGVPPPPPEAVRVNLNAPEPNGESPHWLVFRPGEWKPSPSETYCCWTSDLVAVMVPDAEA